MRTRAMLGSLVQKRCGSSQMLMRYGGGRTQYGCVSWELLFRDSVLGSTFKQIVRMTHILQTPVLDNPLGLLGTQCKPPYAETELEEVDGHVDEQQHPRNSQVQLAGTHLLASLCVRSPDQNHRCQYMTQFRAILPRAPTASMLCTRNLVDTDTRNSNATHSFNKSLFSTE